MFPGKTTGVEEDVEEVWIEQTEEGEVVGIDVAYYCCC